MRWNALHRALAHSRALRVRGELWVQGMRSATIRARRRALRMRGRALPRFSCMMTCTSPKSLQWRKLAQGNRRSARPPAGKWRKCTPKRAFGGPSDVHFPDFLARNGAPARKQAKCTAACSVSGEVHGWLQENGRSARPPVEAFVKCSTTYNNSGGSARKGNPRRKGLHR